MMIKLEKEFRAAVGVKDPISDFGSQLDLRLVDT